MKWKIYFLLVTALVATRGVNAQKEYNNWYFGNKAGLTWNNTRSYSATGMFGTASNTTLTSLPALTRSEINTGEGCFAISDENGDMMFYSDGITIWDAQHNPMPNANGNLTGHPSSVNSGVIIPYPGTDNRDKYIAFTIGFNDANNLSYSVVDMSLRGGLGDVVPGQKNILLAGASGYLGENLAAVRHSNKKDFWIIATGRGGSAYTYFNVWKVDSNGVQAMRHSMRSIDIVTRKDAASGNLIFTENGDRFVWNIRLENYMTFGTFDTTLGQFTSIKKRTRYGQPGYGAAFTKSSEYLYMTECIISYSNLYIFNVNNLFGAANPETVNPIKRITIENNVPNGENTDHMAALAMGPDGYLYGVNYSTRHMYVMPNPEDPANVKIYKLNNFLGTGKNGWGLPTFAAPLFSIKITPPTDSDVCMTIDNDYKIKINGGYEFSDVKSIDIDWGDGKKDIITSPSVGDFTYPHKYAKRGMYTITVTPYKDAARTQPLSDYIEKASIKVKSCMIPVNHNISVMEY